MLKYSTYNSIYHTQPTAPVSASSRIKSYIHRRHIFGILVLFAVLTLTCSGLIHAFAASTGNNSEPVYETLVITSGDTLWNIAVAHKPSGMDTRKYVRMLQSLNHLESSDISAGELLQLPNLP